jgi:hypothetical protein
MVFYAFSEIGDMFKAPYPARQRVPRFLRRLTNISCCFSANWVRVGSFSPSPPEEASYASCSAFT